MVETKTRRRTTQQTAPQKDTACRALAGEGIVLVDGNFELIALNKGAEAILSDVVDGRSGGSDRHASLPPDLLHLLNAQSGLDEVLIFVNACGHGYSCRSFVIKSWSDNITQPVRALYLKQEMSVGDTVFQIGAEYRLTDREQEALIGVAMGLSSKELAVRMHISPNTVKAFLRLIMVKMGATTRAGIVGKLIDQTGRLRVHGAGRQ
jgi:DNA-binding CsgD family transcriptional regulator